MSGGRAVRRPRWGRRGLAVLAVAAGAVLAAQTSAGAQAPVKVPRLGVLLYSTPESDPNLSAFRQGLGALGYVEGKNLIVDYRYAAGKPDRLPELAAELVRLGPDVVFALGGDVVPAARQATRTIPIVMWISNDPVQAGFAESLGRPGGNVTGVTLVLDDLAGKRLGLLKEVAPQLGRVGVLWNPDHADPEFRAMQRAARLLGVQLQSLAVRRSEDFDAAFQAAARDRAEALVVVSSRLVNLNRQRIVEFAERSRVPLVGDWGAWAPGGALLSYGPDLAEASRSAAAYVDRILKGARPAELPIQQPTRFELVIDLAAAKRLGLTVPPSVLVRADRVIQ